MDNRYTHLLKVIVLTVFLVQARPHLPQPGLGDILLGVWTAFLAMVPAASVNGGAATLAFVCTLFLPYPTPIQAEGFSLGATFLLLAIRRIR